MKIADMNLELTKLRGKQREGKVRFFVQLDERGTVEINPAAILVDTRTLLGFCLFCFLSFFCF